MPANDCSPSKGQDSIDSELDELPASVGDPLEACLTDVEMDFTSDVSTISARPQVTDGKAWVHLDIDFGAGTFETVYRADKARELAQNILVAVETATARQRQEE